MTECATKLIASLQEQIKKLQTSVDGLRMYLALKPHLDLFEFEIKPVPREWFLCLTCNRKFYNKVPTHDFSWTDLRCPGEAVRVREVLSE